MQQQQQQQQQQQLRYNSRQHHPDLHQHQYQQQQQRKMQLQEQMQQQQQQQLAAATGKSSRQATSADNMTASSGSEHTNDDLQRLARAYTSTGSGNTSRHHQQTNAKKRNSSSKHALDGWQAISNWPASASNAQLLATSNSDASRSSAALVSSSLSSAHLSRPPSSSSRFLLGILFTVAQLLAFATIGLWAYWCTQHDDGFGWRSDRKQQFNSHALLMLLGFVFFNCQAMLIYRSYAQCCGKLYTKIVHTILHVLGTSCISLGVVLAFVAQENIGPNAKPINHFYSLHAWTGLTAVVLFALQFLFGFVSFLVLLCCGSSTQSYRSKLLPVHKTFGLIIFSLAIASCLMGLLQTARSRLGAKLNKVDYHELAEPGLIINAIGVCLILLAIIVPFIILNLNVSSSQDKSDLRLGKTAKIKDYRALRAAKARELGGDLNLAKLGMR